MLFTVKVVFPRAIIFQCWHSSRCLSSSHSTLGYTKPASFTQIPTDLPVSCLPNSPAAQPVSLKFLVHSSNSFKYFFCCSSKYYIPQCMLWSDSDLVHHFHPLCSLFQSLQSLSLPLQNSLPYTLMLCFENPFQTYPFYDKVHPPILLSKP